jgi:hypothetical protein
VGVDDVRGKIQDPESVEDRPGKKAEALSVFGIVSLDRAVEMPPVKVIIVLDEKNTDAVPPGFPDGKRTGPPGVAEGKLRKTFLDRPVKGKKRKTSWPASARARGRAEATSAKPPVLA